MKYAVEDVFRTEGIPAFTFVRPPNYNEILVDLRNPGKPVVIEGQSGTGKTTTIKKIIEEALPGINFAYLSARKARDIPQIYKVAEGSEKGKFIIDDFHRLDIDVQTRIANLIKVSAEEDDPENNPKIVIIGINKVGSELIHLVHDIAKRTGIHRIKPGDETTTKDLINRGEDKLNINIKYSSTIFKESRGDYWLTQLLCQSICLMNNITETSSDKVEINFSIGELRQRVAARLEHSYLEPVKEFCRGKRFRSTNDPYFKLLKAVSEQDSAIVELTMLANSNIEVRGSINNIKEKRLSILIDSKPICERYFYYNNESKNFAIEDPALFYYLKHLNWERIRTECGFKPTDKDYAFDFALSFAGENRELARIISNQLELLDCSVFFDELFETNFLGKAWRKQFESIFTTQSRLIVVLLDVHHREKIWPTFERECFIPRVQEEAVIPIYLDDTIFPGIPKDTIGIPFKYTSDKHSENIITDKIVFKLIERLDSV
jgi:hypothetical protein